MSGKENCNSFNEFIRLAEQNSRALGDGTEVVKVQPFWLGSESKFKSVPERAQAAMLGLAKEGVLSGEGEGKDTKFFIAGEASFGKQAFRVLSPVKEGGVLLGVVLALTTLAASHNSISDYLGFVLALVFTAVYTMRIIRILSFGQLMNSVPFTKPGGVVFGMPFIKGANLLISVVAAAHFILFFMRIFADMAYPAAGSASFLGASNRSVEYYGGYIGYFWNMLYPFVWYGIGGIVVILIIGFPLGGSSSGAFGVLNKFGLLKMYTGVESANTGESLNIKGKGFVLIVSLAISVYVACGRLSVQWV